MDSQKCARGWQGVWEVVLGCQEVSKCVKVGQDVSGGSLRVSERVWECLLSSAGACWCLMHSWECKYDIWGCLECIQGCQKVFQALRCAVRRIGRINPSGWNQGSAIIPFWHNFEKQDFCHLTYLRHPNIKTRQCKLSKNDWLLPYFVSFWSVRV